MDGENLRLDRDELGIVSELRANRAKWQPYIKARIAERLQSPEFTALIDDLIAAGMADVLKQKERRRLAAEVRATMNNRVTAICEEMTSNLPEPKEILAVCSQVTGISVAELVGPCRMKRLSQPRFLAYFLLKTVRARDLSLPHIGRIMGGRDHTSVMHGLQVFDRKKGEDPYKSWLSDERIVALLSAKV